MQGRGICQHFYCILYFNGNSCHYAAEDGEFLLMPPRFLNEVLYEAAWKSPDIEDMNLII